MTDHSPTYDDGRPVHFTVTPIDELSAKSHALQEALRRCEELEAERDVAKRWAQAWKQLAKRASKEGNEIQRRSLRLITKENPRSAELAYTGLMLMAAFANDQGDDESVEECAFRVVAERDALQRRLDAMLDSGGTMIGAHPPTG